MRIVIPTVVTRLLRAACCCAALVLLLAACQSTGDGVVVTRDDGSRVLQPLATADLEAARAAAEAYDDTLATQCWAGLLAYQEANPLVLTDPVGPASAYQKARNARRTLARGMPDAIKAACGGMVIDSASALQRLLGLGLPGVPGL